MSEQIVQEWLQARSDSTVNADLERHLNLISKQVRLLGVPGFELIGYTQWAAQCEHEFAEKLIQSVSYDGLKIMADSPERIQFQTFESLQTKDGQSISHGIEVLIEKESDGQWRVSQERVLSNDESRIAGLIE